MNELQEKPTALMDQQEALGLYLEALFLPPEVAPAEPETVTQTSTQVITETVIETKVETTLETATQTELAVDTILATETATETEIIEEAPVELADGQPEWAAKPFPVLFVDIDGMEIALPMDHMHGVRKFPEQLTQMPNQADWVHGVVNIHGEQVQVVDAQALLIPGRERTPPEYIVQLGTSRWGLACRLAEESVELPPDQVRWSGESRKRRWVLGMIKKHLCALIDVDAFIEHLETGKAFT